MAVEDVVTDPTLRPILQTSKSTLTQALTVLDWLSQQSHDATTYQQQLELAQQQKILHAYLAKLRGQSRRAAFGARATKQDTAEARQEVDRLLLQLQNLYYEQRHLMGEIGACEGYDHTYARLPLLSEEEYLTLFSDQAELPEEELMPKRIEHEKLEREKMQQQRLELVKVKEALLKENTRKKEELKKMDEKLEALVDGFKSVEEALAKDVMTIAT